MNLEDHLHSLEERLLQPDVRHSAAELTQLLAPEFREFGCSGRTYTRAEVISDLASETTLHDRTLSDFTLLASTPDFALVTYRSTRRDANGAVKAITLRSSTWIHRDDRWQLLFHQGTLNTQTPTT